MFSWEVQLAGQSKHRVAHRCRQIVQHALLESVWAWQCLIASLLASLSEGAFRDLKNVAVAFGAGAASLLLLAWSLAWVISSTRSGEIERRYLLLAAKCRNLTSRRLRAQQEGPRRFLTTRRLTTTRLLRTWPWLSVRIRFRISSRWCALKWRRLRPALLILVLGELLLGNLPFRGERRLEAPLAQHLSVQMVDDRLMRTRQQKFFV